MRIAYSCVVDGDPKFAIQATNLVLSLRAVGVLPQDIVVNLTPSALVYHASFAALGVTVRSVPFFVDGRYCNKIVQLRNASPDFDFTVCCDTDLLFLRNIAAAIAGQPPKVLGKIVDFANPPIKKFAAVLQLFPEIPTLREARSDLDGQPTYAGNFNGGLYVIPGALLRAISAKWEELAVRLYNDRRARDALGEFIWHTDQISFCLTLAALRLEYEALPLEFNYPLHCRVPKAREQAVEELQILHYHTAVDENWLPLDEWVESPVLRRQIAAAAENLRTLWFLDAQRADLARVANRHFTFVVGFHRSGTSLLTAGCEHIGYSTGQGVLMGSNLDNIKGYFENRSLVRINESIHRELESDWDDIFFSFDGRQSELSDKFFARIREFLDKEFPVADRERYVLKDPRVMQTYGLWRSMLDRTGYGSPELVFVCRNPMECAMSQADRYRSAYLNKKDPFHFFGKESLETLVLWYSYNMRFLSTLEEERLIFVRYDDLMSAPRRTLERLAGWAGMHYDPIDGGRFAESFLDKDLRHHQSSLADLRNATRAFPEIADLFVRLDQLCSKDTVSHADIRQIVELHSEPFANLINFSFVGRLFAVAKRNWVHERFMRHSVTS